MTDARRRYRTSFYEMNGIRTEGNEYSYLSSFHYSDRRKNDPPAIEEVRILTRQNGKLYLIAIEQRQLRNVAVKKGQNTLRYERVSRVEINPPQLVES